MRFPRSSGILLHPTSLPGRFGIGDLGPQAQGFVDFLAGAGQTLWQVLPIPLQDVLGLGTEARMNQPATIDGNWRWRYGEGVLTEEIARRLRGLTSLYDRR